MRKINFIVCLLLVVLLPIMALAQGASERSECVKIYFKQGSSVVDQNYMNNGENLVRLAALLEAYMMESEMGKGAISIAASASPEGSTQINAKLVNERAQAIVNLLGEKINSQVGYEIDFVGINWDLLIDEVEANDKVPYRDEVLDILRNTPETITVNGTTINERNRQLEKLRGGAPYRWLLKNIYPNLRYAGVCSDVVYALELRVLTEHPIEIGEEGGKGEILFEKSVKDCVAPKVSVDAKWITEVKSTPTNVTFVATPNVIAEPRCAKVILDYYGSTHEVVVSQKGAKPAITFSSGMNLIAKAMGGSNTVTYTTNVPNAEIPIVECDVEWVRDIVVEKGSISYVVDANTLTESRVAAIKVSSYGNTEYLIIRQQKATPDMIVVDAENELMGIKKSESVVIYFRQGASVIDRNYMNNGENLELLAQQLEPYILDNVKVAGRVRINASASPEGTSRINNHLVNARAKAIADWIGKKFNAKIGYEIDFKGIDWALLLALVEENENVPHKSEVLDIIKNTPEQVTRNGVVINERERLLEGLRGGESYRWMLQNIYPRLRYAAVETIVMYAREMTITSENPVYYTAEGGEGVVTFKKNVDDKVVPNIHCEAEWIKNVTATTSEISYTVEPNHIAEARFSVISVEVYGVAHEVIINQEAAVPVLTVTSENTVVVGSEGGERKVTYITNVPNDTNNPSVRTTADWISEIKQEEDGTITFEIAPNEIAEARSAIVKIEYADQEYDVVVEQVAAEPVLTITSETPVNMTADGGGATVTYTTNVPGVGVANVTSESEWIVSIQVSEEDVTFMVEPSKQREHRSTTLLVESGDQSVEVVVNQEASPCTFPLYMSLSTNTLLDLLLTPNIGAEVYLGANFSVDANWHYAWWKIQKHNYFWRTYGGDLSLRWWFGKPSRTKPLTGHHIGPYGQMITYDFEFGKEGVLADRWSWTVGLEYGYSLPIAERLNLDFTIGAGYHWGEFFEYKPVDGHYVWQATKRRQYMGPTKLEVSLVWLIGCDNYNK